MADALERLLTDDSARAHRAESGLAWVRDRTWKRAAVEVERGIREALALRSRDDGPVVMSRRARAMLLLGACMLAGDGSGVARAGGPCAFGAPVSERVVLAPAPGTFYSVDVLNPDVVRTRHGYRLYFSGNDRRTDAGFWRTGVARSDSPTGRFRVDPGVRLRFLNGGTTRSGGRWYHAASVTAPAGSGPPRCTGRATAWPGGRCWTSRCRPPRRGITSARTSTSSRVLVASTCTTRAGPERAGPIWGSCASAPGAWTRAR